MDLSASSVLIGEQSLLVQCGELWLERGGSVDLVGADNPVIIDWCRSKGIPVVSGVKGVEQYLEQHQLQFDYLFSITNLQIIRAELLRKPAQLAVNFHDGPLPYFAGLNAPVWALQADETNYGVSWHIMDVEVDKGNLLVQEHFPIVPGETAFSLNTKCYQAGLDSFARLLDSFASGEVTGMEQNSSEGSYFGLTHRSPAMATIDFTQPVEQADRLVRSLDFGPYPNPVGLPKLFLGDDVVLVRKAEISTDVPATQLGQILEVDASSLSIAFPNGAIRFSEIENNRGDAVNPQELLIARAWSVGSVLPELTDELRSSIDQAVPNLCRGEDYWHDSLVRLEPLEIPYTSKQAKAGSRLEVRSICVSDAVPEVRFLSAIALLLGRLGLKQRFNIGLDCVDLFSDELCAGYIASCLALEVELKAGLPFSQLEENLSGQLVRIRQGYGHFADMHARYPELRSIAGADSLPAKVVFGDRPGKVRDDQVVFCLRPDGVTLDVHFHDALLAPSDVDQLLSHLAHLLAAVSEDDARSVTEYSVISPEESARLAEWNQTTQDYNRQQCVHQYFEQQVIQDPARSAVVFEDVSMSYGELNAASNRLAHYLMDSGVVPGRRIGILVGRSVEMMVALMASLKAGCAYVPLDPLYPADRLNYMVNDADLEVVLCLDSDKDILGSGDYRLVVLEDIQQQLHSFSDTNPALEQDVSDLAYVIYTSGSTGKPKGTMVEHRNVVNFFTGMDQRLEPGPGVWLAVTSISFDISVLELFWTLGRGLTVILYADERRQLGDRKVTQSQYPEKEIDFGLFYWNVATDESKYDTDKYRLLLESAQFGDRNGFNSVWTPERHFASFGGLFPNPSLTSAALSTITQNVDLRAGSCVAPLHSPIRIAEEWSVVDNLSNGRVGIAIAAGWAPPDFAIMPENFANAKEKMFEIVDLVQQLWRGDTVMFPGPNGKEVPVTTLPRPIQQKLPIWVTTAGNEDTYRQAGKMGAGILTHLLGQTIEEVAEKVAIYRAEWQAAGHPGQGTVSLMLHTFIGEDEETVEEHVREPMKAYLKSAMFLVKSAAWQFPTFKKMSEDQGKSLDEFFDTISDEDMDALLEFAFQRYFHTSGLFGTPASAMAMVDKVKAADINEIACLIDFGIDTDLVLDHLPYLSELLSTVKTPVVKSASQEDYSLPSLFERHDVTHFQCTPSMATMLAADTSAQPGLAKLKQMMVGGEAFPPQLAEDLRKLCGGRITNMYGPTETTIWSSTSDVEGELGNSVSIGKPLANQRCYILDENQQALPVGVAGELVIGGEGVVRGYHNQPELTDDRFIADTIVGSGRMYRTGDLARWLPDGTLECLGRVDHQVKIRGYRVELGEIEALLRSHESVAEAAVLLREDTINDKRLVAYIVPTGDERPDGSKLREHLKQQLPEFMVPVTYMELAALPLTPNGKIDRKALPEPKHAAPSDNAEIHKPENQWEALVMEIWQEALGLPEVSTRDNFFDIGGHSLLVLQVLKELREKISKPLQMTDLFKYTTVATLAAFIASDEEDASAISQGQARAEKRRVSRGRRRARAR